MSHARDSYFPDGRDAPTVAAVSQHHGVLEGRVAIVTGAARGIGLATATLLSEQGARVVLADLDADLVAESAAGLPGDATTFAGDITKDGTPDRLVDAAIGAFGQLDIIVNNAGYSLDAPLHKLSDDWFQRMLDIHLVAPFRVIRAAAPHLREPAKVERAEGREVFRKIVNVSSTTGTMGNAGQANYAAGKAGIVGVTKTLAKEWGQFKINVNAVAFSWIDTRMIAPKVETNTMEIGGETVQLGVPGDMRELARDIIPIGRPGSPAEAAGAVFLLCSPWSNFIHGQVLTVSGGAPGGMSA
jgi:3-oxoacyl-[acyl-carrier protein] reductase